MNTHELPRRIPEYGVAHGAYRERRSATATIAAVCALAFVYDAFPAVAHILNITALVLAVSAGILALAWLACRPGVSR